jgi:hypothetical protein
MQGSPTTKAFHINLLPVLEDLNDEIPKELGQFAGKKIQSFHKKQQKYSCTKTSTRIFEKRMKKKRMFHPQRLYVRNLYTKK